MTLHTIQLRWTSAAALDLAGREGPEITKHRRGTEVYEAREEEGVIDEDATPRQ